MISYIITAGQRWASNWSSDSAEHLTVTRKHIFGMLTKQNEGLRLCVFTHFLSALSFSHPACFHRNTGTNSRVGTRQRCLCDSDSVKVRKNTHTHTHFKVSTAFPWSISFCWFCPPSSFLSVSHLYQGCEHHHNGDADHGVCVQDVLCQEHHRRPPLLPLQQAV